MRVGTKILLVGGLPITVAALIAVAAWLLLAEAERARGGAVLAGSIYRDLTVVAGLRDDYIGAAAPDREAHARSLRNRAGQARAGLDRLAPLARTTDQMASRDEARQALDRYVSTMERLVAVTRDNDALIGEMVARAAALVDLADQARRRQRQSNADLVASLTAKDAQLRLIRDVVENAHALRQSLAALDAAGESPEGGERPRAGLGEFRGAVKDLAATLRADGRERDAAELEALAAAYEAGRAAPPAGAGRPLLAWCDRLIKLDASESRALHDEVAQLLTYSVQANETEQATQSVAVATLKLGQRTASALAGRDVAAALAILEEGGRISATAASLPISPLIQTEMVDAIDGWRERLGTTIEGLRRQNGMIAEMDRLAATMIESARRQNDLFTGDAERFGAFIRQLLLAGSVTGLLIGSITGLAVARSITAPLRRLQGNMVALAADPTGGQVPDADRRDELGDIARATNFFLTEIGRRTQALRRAKDQADTALADLRRTQASLLQAEKLASLGELVAGVAHEINTPLGIALTTATLVRDEAGEFRRMVAAGQLSRSRLTRFVDRVEEGTQLLFSNLTRAADLVHSFKQVAVDRVSDERRRFDMGTWLAELLRSLGPLLRKVGHEAQVECPPGLVVDTHPGALAQVVTNLVNNAVVHAYEPGEPGPIRIRVAEAEAGWVRLEVGDQGRGIAEADLARIFDPFFTTARHRGSTGLGMPIVYNLVTSKLGGRIAVESRPGKGTLFRVELPGLVRTGEGAKAAPTPA